MSLPLASNAVPPKALIGASIPRSGHHFMQSLLSHYFGPDLYYCEVYTRADCCHQVPCVRGAGRTAVYQKSHDRRGEIPKDVAEAIYVIQYREPVSEALSDRELDLSDRLGRRSLNYRLSTDHYAWWLAGKAAYYRNFHDKWFSPRVENGVYLDYAFLSGNPHAALTSIAQVTAGRADEFRVASAVERAGSVRAGAVHRKSDPAPYTPRKIEDSPHFDRELLAAFEAYVLQRCPNFGFSPRLGNADAAHPFFGLVLLHDEREPLPNGATDRLDAAAKFAPHHPEIALRLAKRDISQGAPELAIPRLETLLAGNPFFGPAYRQLFGAYEEIGRAIPYRYLDGNAVFACSDSPKLLAELAAVYGARGMAVNALAALSMAAALAPDDFRINHLYAKALADEKRWELALIHADRAAALRPNSKANTQLLSKARKQAGQGASPSLASSVEA
ncbi:MAG: hypothetical protein JO056_09845 [Alphaproteobacteria bacterium]|nr:hypothetical protein [Alphaproteobacteria bacterium]